MSKHIGNMVRPTCEYREYTCSFKFSDISYSVQIINDYVNFHTFKNVRITSSQRDIGISV